MNYPDTLIAQAAQFSPTSFLHKLHNSLGSELLLNLETDFKKGNIALFSDDENQTTVYYRHLQWDSEYFGVPTYRIELMCSESIAKPAIDSYRKCINSLSLKLKEAHGSAYLFAEIPSEAIFPIQALCLSEWRLVETRLTYYTDQIQSYNYPKRFPVRDATLADIENLKSTAMKSRNDFDRFHADYFFSEQIADKFLATFVENSVRGFADITLVPNPDENSADAFLTANLLPANPSIPDKSSARMILSAVGEKRRGWYVKLISEMSYIFKDKGIDVAFMTTQSTNKAVIRTWEKLGYSYGKSSHVFVKVI
ncbi:hypothetical protein [Pseudomonas sp. lyk4-TYG-107]|uniref:hypothetical protein n=1 Tax=Pseudomonas sp. lyk4-TYG-107 TaxID=3040317 RepID=UPI0025567BD9|nr:hypothetical protein [Pseudomonas sp. lyk4-TYG-107]